MPIQRAKPRIVDLDQTPLTGFSGLTVSDFPAGTVIQTQHYTYTGSALNGTSTSFQDAWSVTFTPTKAGNSIWQLCQWTDLWEGNEHNSYRIVDDTSGTDILLCWDAQQSAGTSGWASTNRSLNDLLTNCAAQTYTFRLQCRGYGSNTNYWFSYGQGNSVGSPPAHWTIMEIEA